MPADLVGYPDRRSAARTRRLAEDALVRSLAAVPGVKLDARNRARDRSHVLCLSIPEDAREAALADVRAGDGGELRTPTKGSTRLPRFNSFRSSCALAVNAFGPWRLEPSSLRVAGIAGFTSLGFEQKLRIRGADRRPPNLDVVATGPTALAIESKLIEHLARAKRAEFAPVYDDAVSSLADASWRSAYEMLKADPVRYRYFGAAQVVKHYLGIKSAQFARPACSTSSGSRSITPLMICLLPIVGRSRISGYA